MGSVKMVRDYTHKKTRKIGFTTKNVLKVVYQLMLEREVMKYKSNTLVNELEELNEGVEYILEFYKDKQLLTKQEIETTTSNGEAEIIARNKILHAIIKVIQIQNLRGFEEGFYSIDSFVREEVFDIITRELDNE
jgi:hypothetical protein